MENQLETTTPNEVIVGGKSQNIGTIIPSRLKQLTFRTLTYIFINFKNNG